MATHGDSKLAVDILQSSFPTLDEAVKQYVEGLLLKHVLFAFGLDIPRKHLFNRCALKKQAR